MKLTGSISVLLSCVGLFIRVQAFAVQSINLTWDANPDTNIVGYVVYQGTASRSYTNVVFVGKTNNATLSGIPEDVTCYFAITARDAMGVESGFSNEVSWSVPTAATLTAILAAPADPSIWAGAAQEFRATGIYSDGSTRELTSQATWISSSPAVAVINSGGLATAMSSGTTTISAALGGVSGSSTLTVQSPPIITTQPSSRTNVAGRPGTFSVVANGTAPLTYQWRFNESDILDATNDTYAIQAVLATHMGSYSVVVTNSAGSAASSNAVLTVLVPPTIGIQPASQSVAVSGAVTFNVAADGTAPFGYQWRFNASDILDATNDTYAIQSVGTNDSGNYSVVVTNLAGSVASSNALLTILVPPMLALQIWAGYPLLTLEGMLSNSFVVQYGTNFGDTNWVNLVFIPNLPTSPYQFLDPAGVSQPMRFYRALMQ